MRLQVVLTVCGFEDVFSPLQTPEWRPVIPFVLHWRHRLQQLLFYLWDKAYGTSTTLSCVPNNKRLEFAKGDTGSVSFHVAINCILWYVIASGRISLSTLANSPHKGHSWNHLLHCKPIDLLCDWLVAVLSALEWGESFSLSLVLCEIQGVLLLCNRQSAPSTWKD